MTDFRTSDWSDESERSKGGETVRFTVKSRGEGEVQVLKPLWDASLLVDYSICKEHAKVKRLNRIFKYTFPF